MISSLFALLLPISAASQFVPRFPYYSPQDFLLEYYDPYPSYSSSSHYSPARAFGERQMALRDLPLSSPSQDKFDPFARQPGVVPQFTGGFLRSSTARPSAPSEDPFAQPGVAPKFTGSFLKGCESSHPHITSAQAKALDAEEEHRKPDAAVNSFQGPVTNPAAHFLAGTHFEKLSTPKCRMLNCAGPVPNDGSLSTAATLSGKRSACSQVLVPINGCAGGDGYPMAMLCSVCCECTAPLVSELFKSAANFRARA
ncbi:hypothetical protein PMAYCL1PPCAC_28571 [Pristionchus mayeri]|uniref:Uncharacterized protein n=1 Tax=Pristionchus mayeri TaxID=1317129 RepID=A0AAN5D8I8_9BILA|nr:hypothetical protein PMAYCL1PPCAC_28571 [Pristionchus mayeri]